MVKSDDTGRTFRNEVQIVFSVNPQSRFVFSACLWISMASSTLLFQYAGSCFSTLAFSQSTHACTAISLFVSPLLSAALCSTNLFQAPLSLTDVWTATVHTRDLIHYSFFQQLWSRILHFHQCFVESSSRLEHCLYSYLFANLLYVLWCVLHIWEVNHLLPLALSVIGVPLCWLGGCLCKSRDIRLVG